MPAAYEHRVYAYPNGECGLEYRYRLLAPAVLETGRRYPAILFLHGAGERGTDNEAQLKYLPSLMAEPGCRERYPCFVIAPQCRPDTTWCATPWDAIDCDPLPPEPTAELAAVIGILDHALATLPIDTRRIYLTGLSMGGYGAWELAMRQPERFAAIVPICGGGDESQAAQLAKIPVWAWHGEADDVVPVDRSRRMVAAINRAGGAAIYTELPGVGHDSWTPAYTRDDGVIPWMFAQAKNEPRSTVRDG